MKNKKNIFILLPLVLLIWGSVLYQFFSFTTAEETQQLDANNFKIKPLKFKERDSFTIDVNYRDPFLGKMYASQKNDSLKNSNLKKSRTQKITEPLTWPTIVYKGIVSDTKDKTKIYMVIIAGKTFLMRKGAVENEIFLKDGDRESIYVKYKGNLNLIMLQE
jgi:hypothetical protein